MRRIVELDALRGLAGILIVLHHFQAHGHLFGGRVVLLERLGWSAVDLFFVLSGFLITSIILRHGDGPGFYRAFYARRSLRIWPIYYLTLLGFVIVNARLAHPYRVDALPQYLTYTQDVQAYWGGRIPPFDGPFGHTWTLAIEEQFYLIWPALLMLVGTRRVVALSVAVAATSAVIRTTLPGHVLAALHLGRVPAVSPWLLLGRCDGFAAGALLAALVRDPARFERLKPRLRPICAALAVVLGGYLVAGAYLIRRPQIPLAYTATTWFYFALIGLVLTALGRPILRPLRWGPLVHAGVVSYGLYLYHPLIEAVITLNGDRLGLLGHWWTGWLMFAASLGAALLSWSLIERPILGLKEYFRYDRRPAVAAVAPLEASGSRAV